MCEPGDYSVESKERPIFRELTADDDNPEVTEIESLCMTCGNNVSNGLLRGQDFKQGKASKTSPHQLYPQRKTAARVVLETCLPSTLNGVLKEGSSLWCVH